MKKFLLILIAFILFFTAAIGGFKAGIYCYQQAKTVEATESAEQLKLAKRSHSLVFVAENPLCKQLMETITKPIVKFIADDNFLFTTRKVSYLLGRNGMNEFASVKELPMLNILNYYRHSVSSDDIISLKAFEAFVDKRFGANIFNMEQLLAEVKAEPNITLHFIDDDQFTISGFSSFSGGCFQSPKREISGNKVTIYYEDAWDGEDNNRLLHDVVSGQLTLEVTEDNFQIISYLMTPNRFGFSDIAFPFFERLSLKEIDQLLLGNVEKIEYIEVYPDEFEEKRYYDTGTVANVWLGDKDSSFGLIQQIETTDPNVKVIYNLGIGDSLETVTSYFLDSHYEPETIFFDSENKVPSHIKRLYGEISHMERFGCIEYDGTMPRSIQYNIEGMGIEFILNDEQFVSKIRIWG